MTLTYLRSSGITTRSTDCCHVASDSLSTLQSSLAEVEDLQRANPTPTGANPAAPATTRAIGRASVVLLCSHFERYQYSLHEELVDVINAASVFESNIPVSIRLRHSQTGVDELADAQWDRSENLLRRFMQTDSSLWIDGAVVNNIDHSRLLVWMKTPSPKNLIRAYRAWGIDDIFSSITRKPTTRQHLWLQIDGLVAKRNNIAHGDLSEEATQSDVRRYSSAVRIFCQRVDRQVSRLVARQFGIGMPW